MFKYPGQSTNPEGVKRFSGRLQRVSQGCAHTDCSSGQWSTQRLQSVCSVRVVRHPRFIRHWRNRS